MSVEPRRGARRSRALVLSLVALALLATGLVLLPSLARPLVESRLERALGIPVSIGLLWWNPLQSEIGASGLVLNEGDQRIAAKRVTVQFGLRDALAGEVRLREVSLVGLQLSVDLDEDLVPHVRGLPPASGPEAQETALPDVDLPLVALLDSSLELHGLAELAPEPLRVWIDRLEARDVALRDGGRSLHTAAELAGTLAGIALGASATVQIVEGRPAIQARVQLQDVDLARVELARPAALTRLAGRLDAVVEYAHEASGRRAADVSGRLRELAVATSGGLALRADEARFEESSLDLASGALGLGRITLVGASLDVDLAAASRASAAKNGAAGVPPPIALKELVVERGALVLRRGDARSELTLEQARWSGLAKDRMGELSVRAAGADGGRAALTGRAGLQPLRAELALDAQGLDVAVLAALAGPLPLVLAQGKAGARLDLRYGDAGARATGTVELGELRTAPPDPAEPSEVLAVHRATAHIEAELGPVASWQISELRLEYPYLMVRRDADGVFPFNVWAPEAGAAGDARNGSRFVVVDLEVEGGRVDVVEQLEPSALWVGLAEIAAGATRVELLPAPSLGRFELSALHDELSPVRASGDWSGPAPTAHVEGTKLFVETLSPRFAPVLGYAASSGFVSLDARARKSGDRVAGDGRVVLEHVKLVQTGLDAVQQETGVPLPVALSLLADRGVIELDLELSWDIVSGAFELGPIVGQAFVRALRSALVSPLRLLGSLFGKNGPPHAFAVEPIPFPAEGGALAGAGRTRARQLARILHSRPGLLLIAMPQVSDEEIAAIGADAAAQLAEARSAAVREALTAGEDAVAEERVISVPWTPAVAADATRRPGVYVELQAGS